MATRLAQAGDERMSGTNRKFVFAYTFLVILPLLGLAGILKSGRRLAAPPSIDGLWSLQVDPAQFDSLPCGRVLAAIPDKTISISQSGSVLALSFPSTSKITSLGTLDGTTVRASLNLPQESSPERGCGGRKLLLLATIDRPAGSRSLVGTLSVTDCPTCASARFRAERQSPAAAAGGH
jgi:hypothetical protein